MKSLTLYVVMTPIGDRPYVSINKPQSYIDHLDASGEKAEVYEIALGLPDHEDAKLKVFDDETNEVFLDMRRLR